MGSKCQYPLSLLLNRILLYDYLILFLKSPVDRHLDYFHTFLSSLWGLVFIFLGYIFRRAVASFYDKLVFNFLRSCHTLPSYLYHLPSHQQCMGGSDFSTSSLMLVVLYFWLKPF